MTSARTKMRSSLKPPPASTNGYAQRNAEIQRLRAAMVHAMDSCESALVLGVNGRALTHIAAARAALKVALEKK